MKLYKIKYWASVTPMDQDLEYTVKIAAKNSREAIRKIVKVLDEQKGAGQYALDRDNVVEVL